MLSKSKALVFVICIVSTVNSLLLCQTDGVQLVLMQSVSALIFVVKNASIREYSLLAVKIRVPASVSYLLISSYSDC
jgi:hypothetical protein